MVVARIPFARPLGAAVAREAPALLSSAGAGLLVASICLWLVEVQVGRLMLEHVAARAVEQVELGVRDRVSPADFEPPFTVAHLDDLDGRLDPVLRRVRHDGSEIIRINIVARDGTVVYSDLSEARGRTVEPREWQVLAPALVGEVSSQRTRLDGVENRDLRSRYDEAIEVYVPVRLNDTVVGGYEVYARAWPAGMNRGLLWLLLSGVVTGLVFGITRIARPAAGSTAPHPHRLAGARVLAAGPLTPRELEVLRLLASTHSYQEIATELVISEETVRTHVKSILRKLGQRDRTQAVLAAVQRGILELPSSHPAG